MTQVVLNYPKEEAKDIIKQTFERTRGISQYHDGGRQIVGKTGVSFPRVLWSYGESVYVDISDSPEEGVTPITVSAEKEVSINIGANAQKFKRRFLNELDAVVEEWDEEQGWGESTSETTIADSARQNQSGVKEVSSSSQLSNGGFTAIILAILGIPFMWIMFMTMLPY